MTAESRLAALRAVAEDLRCALNDLRLAYEYAHNVSPVEPAPIPDFEVDGASLDATHGLTAYITCRTLRARITPHFKDIGSGSDLRPLRDLKRPPWPLRDELAAAAAMRDLAAQLREFAAKIRRDADEAAAASETLAWYKSVAAEAMLTDSRFGDAS